jgi:hypothetical protein
MKHRPLLLNTWHSKSGYGRRKNKFPTFSRIAVAPTELMSRQAGISLTHQYTGRTPEVPQALESYGPELS